LAGSCKVRLQATDYNQALFVWLISHQLVVLFSQNKPAINNQPTVLFSQNKPAPAITHQQNEEVVPRKSENKTPNQACI
jgi:hypothetical protein